MVLIEWHESYATGIPGVDYEHETLIAMINDFHAELAGNTDKDVLINMLNDIYGAIYSHFMLEERQMEKYGYDHYQVHREDHGRLLDEIRDIITELEEMSRFDELQLKEKLNNWFAVHFKTHDARLHRLEELIASEEKSGRGFMAAIKKIFTQAVQ